MEDEAPHGLVLGPGVRSLLPSAVVSSCIPCTTFAFLAVVLALVVPVALPSITVTIAPAAAIAAIVALSIAFALLLLGRRFNVIAAAAGRNLVTIRGALPPLQIIF